MSLSVNQNIAFRGETVRSQQNSAATDPIEKTQNTEKENKKGLSTGAWIGLGALAAAAIAGIAIAATHGRGTKAVEHSESAIPTVNSNSKSDLLEQIKKLKDSIRSNYLSQRHAKQGDLFNRPGITSNISTSVKSQKFKKDHLGKCEKEIETSKQELKTFSNNVRTKLKELSTDSDWRVCREWKKQNAGKWDETTGSKLYLVNAVIEAKITGHSRLLEYAGISVEDAMAIIKDSSKTAKDATALITKN